MGKYGEKQLPEYMKKFYFSSNLKICIKMSFNADEYLLFIWIIEFIVLQIIMYFVFE